MHDEHGNLLLNQQNVRGTLRGARRKLRHILQNANLVQLNSGGYVTIVSESTPNQTPNLNSLATPTAQPNPKGISECDPAFTTGSLYHTISIGDSSFSLRPSVTDHPNTPCKHLVSNVSCESHGLDEEGEPPNSNGDSFLQACTTMPAVRPTVNEIGSYPWLRVQCKHMSTRVLNDRGLPWEWDHCRDHIIIKKWTPRKELDILFEQSRDMKKSRNLVLDVLPRIEPYQTSVVKSDQRRKTSLLGRKRRFCRPVTDTLTRFGFDEVDDEDVERRLSANMEVFGASILTPDGGKSEKSTDWWKTRKEIEVEIEELGRQRIETRIQRRKQEKQNTVKPPFPTVVFPRVHTNTVNQPDPRPSPSANTFPLRRPSQASSNPTLRPKIVPWMRSFSTHRDSDSGFLMPDDPIPGFGASLLDLAFDEQSLSSVLQSSVGKSDDGCQSKALMVDVHHDPAAYCPDAASQRL